nr:MAG TPA: hypothetical protein [Caudoviricetes sp.]
MDIPLHFVYNSVHETYCIKGTSLLGVNLLTL